MVRLPASEKGWVLNYSHCAALWTNGNGQRVELLGSTEVEEDLIERIGRGVIDSIVLTIQRLARDWARRRVGKFAVAEGVDLSATALRAALRKSRSA